MRSAFGCLPDQASPTKSVQRSTGWDKQQQKSEEEQQALETLPEQHKGINARMCRRISGTMELPTTQPWLPGDANPQQVWSLHQEMFGSQMFHEAFFWQSLSHLSERNRQYAQDMLQQTVQGNHVRQVNQKRQFFWVNRWIQLCLLGLLQGVDSRAPFSAPCLQAHPQLNMQDTYHQPRASGLAKESLQKELGNRSKMCSIRQPSGSRGRLGRAWLEWEKSQSSTSRASQAANRCQNINGWSESQLQSSARTNCSCTETKLEAKNQQGTQQAKGPTHLSITIFSGSSTGFFQRVLEQDIEMHDVCL